MTTASAEKIVLEQLLAQAAGIRMRAKNPVVGTRAGQIEQEPAQRLAKATEASREQAPLFNAAEQEDDAPAAVNFSLNRKPESAEEPAPGS